MKKLSVYITLGMLLLLAVPNYMQAASNDPVPTENAAETEVNETTELTVAEMEAMVARVYEIKDMKKSDLSKTERKELRNEVKEIRRELKEAGNGGLYISTGAIIIILLLIIIL